MNIYESAEDYLERILMVRERKGIVYSIDIAHELNFSKPSVSVAMKRFSFYAETASCSMGIPCSNMAT